jgi:hypothetical protein
VLIHPVKLLAALNFICCKGLIGEKDAQERIWKCFDDRHIAEDGIREGWCRRQMPDLLRRFVCRTLQLKSGAKMAGAGLAALLKCATRQQLFAGPNKQIRRAIGHQRPVDRNDRKIGRRGQMQAPPLPIRMGLCRAEGAVGTPGYPGGGARLRKADINPQ